MAEDVKFSITGEDKSWQSSLDKAERSTARAAQRMSSSFDSVEKAQKRAFGGAGGNTFGAVALQAQDIAVQLEAGAGAARVLSQQGSQILSVFGPGGAIAGGALSVGVLIHQWVTNTEAANKAFEESARRLKDAQAAAKGLLAGAAAADERRALGGTTGGRRKMLEEEFRHAKAIKEIEEKSAQTGDKAAARIAMEAENALHAKEKALAADEIFNENLEKRNALEKELEGEKSRGRSAAKQREELSLSNAEKLKRVELEISAIRNRSAVSSTASLQDRIRDAKSIANLEEKQLEATKLRIAIEEEGRKNREKGEREAQKQLNSFAQGWQFYWENVARAIDAAKKQVRKLNEESAAKKLEAFNKRVADRRKTPQEKAEDRREERAQARAQREVIRRDLKGQTLRDPITGRIQKFESMGGASRDAIIRQRMGAINAANEQGVTELSDASIQKLAAALSTEMTKVVSQ